jgi:hypothetical protein
MDNTALSLFSARYSSPGVPVQAFTRSTTDRASALPSLSFPERSPDLLSASTMPAPSETFAVPGLARIR